MRDFDGTKLLNDGYGMEMLDRRHLRRAMKLLREKDDFEWTTKPPPICYLIWVEIRPIFPSQATMLGNIADVWLGTMRPELTHTDVMQRLLRYVQAF